MLDVYRIHKAQREEEETLENSLEPFIMSVFYKNWKKGTPNEPNVSQIPLILCDCW